MTRTPLDMYDDLPKSMKRYLQHNGWHFNKKACEWAVNHMKKHNESTGKSEEIEPWSKDQVDELLKSNSTKLDNNVGYDYVFVANMCKADYFKSSVPDEAHVAMFVKDTIDDSDGADGMTFRRWYASMVALGIPVEWEEIL